MSGFPNVRLRRLRGHAGLRAMLRRHDVQVRHLIYPLFVHHDRCIKKPIEALPDTYQWGLDQLGAEIDALVALGIPAVLLFGIPAVKDAEGRAAFDEKGVIPEAIRLIKRRAPHLLVITDLCFCGYTDHGHCGVLSTHTSVTTIDNDASLALLTRQALVHAAAGSDMIAPSGMLDGMVSTLRAGLDGAGYHTLPILSYAAKFHSCLYGPFRVASEGTPKAGDRAGYQMEVTQSAQALREIDLDIKEGADMVIVKPAHTYLDIIMKAHQAYPAIPLLAYHVSGECAWLWSASEKGVVDERAAVIEVFQAMQRAGACLIISYYAKRVAMWLSDSAL